MCNVYRTSTGISNFCCCYPSLTLSDAKEPFLLFS